MSSNLLVLLEHPKIKPLVIFSAFFIFLNTLLFYGFVRDGTWLVIAILLIPVYRQIGLLNFLLSSLSFLFGTVVAIFIFEYGFPQLTYWPPFDRLKSTDENGLIYYKPNQNITVQLPYGQLKPWSREDEIFDLRPRVVSVKTDSMGFRNSSDYNHEEFVLAGDSMIAGAGSSQDDILSSQLKSEFGVNVYNVAVPGADILDYVKNIQKFKSLHGKSFKTIMFITELNDFVGPTLSPSSKDSVAKTKKFYKKWIRRYKKLFQQNVFYRFQFSVYRNFTKGTVEGGENRIFIGDIGTHRVAFFRPTMRENYSFPDEIVQAVRSVKDQIAYMVFIPKKFRVYFRMIKQNPYASIKNVEWLALQSLGVKLGIPTLNFTELMEEESQKLLRDKNELLFWEDDSHWNANGARTTAGLLCKTIQELGCATPRVH